MKKSIVCFIIFVLLFILFPHFSPAKSQLSDASCNNFLFDERHSGFYPFSTEFVSGIPKGKLNVGSPFTSVLVLNNGYIFVNSASYLCIFDNYGGIVSLIKRSGEIPYASPVILNNLLIFTMTNTILAGYDIVHKNIVWRFFGDSRINTPLVYGNNIYFLTEKGYLYALDSYGKLIWKVFVDMSTLKTPIISNSLIYTLNDLGSLYSIDTNGKVVWEFPLLTNQLVTHGAYLLASKDNMLFAAVNGKNEGTLFAIKDKKVVFTYKTGLISSNPAVDELGNVYIGDADGKVYAINSAGKLLWSFTTNNGSIQSGCTISSDGTIFAVTSQNTLYAITKNGQLRWKYNLPSETFSPVVIANDGTLFVNARDELYVFNDYILSVEGSSSCDVTLEPKKSHYAPNEIIKLTAKPKLPFSFLYWKSSPDEQIYKDNPLYLTMNMNKKIGREEIHIKAVVSLLAPIYKYNIEASSNGYGKITPEKATVVMGDSLTFTFQPIEFYTVKDVLLDGISVINSVTQLDNGSFTYTLSNINQDHKIYVKFEKLNYCIVAKAGEGGKIVPSGIITLNPHESVIFTIIPDFGYEVKDVLVDGKSVGKEFTHGFLNVLGNHTITAEFQKQTFIIEANSVGPGNIEPVGKIRVYYGDSKTFNFIPNEGMKVADVNVDNISIGPQTSYTFTKISTNHKITVFFERKPIEYKIILKIGEEGFSVNGVVKKLDSPPVIKNGRTLVAIRPIIESIGGTISWNANNRSVYIETDFALITLWIGKPNATVEIRGTGISEIKPIDPDNPKVVPEIINSRTMLPLRFISENLGGKVDWDPINKTITIVFVL
ncbi:PQQ-binding-like beta-propeller repeat protein [Caldisericum sp.]|uniref:stalk domain-containing protein n=1 Tax=Caldisericum sp. TaxID=2499687 RepID=UPI003D0A1439